MSSQAPAWLFAGGERSHGPPASPSFGSGGLCWDGEVAGDTVLAPVGDPVVGKAVAGEGRRAAFIPSKHAPWGWGSILVCGHQTASKFS